MFCWGSTVHGELGLGGIEDETILTPRQLDFQKASSVEQSELVILFIEKNLLEMSRILGDSF